MRHAYIVHSLPFVCSYVLLRITNSVLIRRHWQGLSLFGVIYAIQNYFAVKKEGKAMYWFLSWEDYTSVLIVGLLVSIFCGLFYTTARYDEYVKQKSSIRGIYSKDPQSK